MELYRLYLIVFGTTSLIGVPILSYTQYIFIHGMTVKDWVDGLPTTVGIVIFLMGVVAFVMYIVMKPLVASLKKSQTEELTQDEKMEFMQVFEKMNMVSTIVLGVCYVIGNAALIAIKTAKGIFVLGSNPGEVAITLVMLLGVCIIYFLIAREYCVHFFNSLAQRTIVKIHINDIGDQKVTHFTASIGFICFMYALFVCWHTLCCGYKAARYGNTNVTEFISLSAPVILFSIIYPFALMSYILTNLRKRFTQTTTVIKEIRANGDLTHRLDISAFDDFGKTNDELNKLIDSLNGTLEEIKEQAYSVDVSAKTLLSTSEESASGMNQVVSNFKDIEVKNDNRNMLLDNTKDNITKLNQSAKQISSLMTAQTEATEENASAITEMVANINSIGEMVKKSQTLSEELASLSETGNTEVTGTLNIITDITEKSKQMMEVTKVIQSVASQTNLLAMNAAIEAAHAGSAGSGFAVVADEIRKLAESTTKSTKDIKEMIEQLINSINQSSSRIDSTSRAFNQISKSITAQQQLVGTIARATEEQGIGASETLKATNDISDQITEINTLMKQQAAYSHEVEENIETVLALSSQVNSALSESNIVIERFAESIETTKNSALDNQVSIETMNNEIDRFKLS